MEVPEQAVMGQEHFGSGLDGCRDRLLVGRDGGRYPSDLETAGHLEPVRSVVAEAVYLEQLVAESDDFVPGGHRFTI